MRIGSVCLLILSILGAGEWGRIGELARAIPDRSPLGAESHALAQLLEAVAKLDPEQLASAAKSHADKRTAALQRATATTDAKFSPYRDLMRFPLANRGFAVAISGKVIRATDQPEDGAGRLVYLTPENPSSEQWALLFPQNLTPPEPGTQVAAVGIFAKRMVVERNGNKIVAPLIVAPDWATRKVKSGSAGLAWEVVEDAVDEVRGVRPQEAELYYQVLAKAASVSPAAIRRKAREVKADRREENPQWFRRGEYWMFKDIMVNPEEMRGRPITLRGYAREIRQYPAGDNAAGIETLHEIWLFTDKSQSNPAVIVATDVPEDLPVGNDLIVPLRVTGYFFKLYGYHAGPKGRIAPMLLAGPVEILSEPQGAGFPWWMIGLIATGSIAALVAILLCFRGERRRARQPGEESPDLSSLE